MADAFKLVNKWSTTRFSDYLWGSLPSLATVASLVLLGGVLAVAPMLWAGAAWQLSTYMSYMAYASLAVVGFAGFNYWFDREIQYFSLGCANVNPDELVDEKNPIDVIRLVNHLRQELNAHDGSTDVNHPNHMPMPRVATFKDHHPKIVVVPGRSLGRSAIYISTGMLNHHDTNFTQKELAAIIMAELAKIKSRRSLGNTLLSIADGISKLFDNLMASQNPFIRGLGYILGPLRFCFFLVNAMQRSHVYRAANVVIECGRGSDYFDALEKTNNPNRIARKSAPASLRPPYLQPVTDWMNNNPVFKYIAFIGRGIDSVLKPLADWVDKMESPTDEKQSTYRIFSFFDFILRNTLFMVKELGSNKPSGPNLKEHVKEQNERLSDAKTFKIEKADRYLPADKRHGELFTPRFKKLEKGALKKLDSDGIQNLFAVPAKDERLGEYASQIRKKRGRLHELLAENAEPNDQVKGTKKLDKILAAEPEAYRNCYKAAVIHLFKSKEDYNDVNTDALKEALRSKDENYPPKGSFFQNAR